MVNTKCFPRFPRLATRGKNVELLRGRCPDMPGKKSCRFPRSFRARSGEYAGMCRISGTPRKQPERWHYVKIERIKRIKPFITRKISAKSEQEQRKYLNLRNRYYVDLATVRGFAESVLTAVHDLLDEVTTAEHALLDSEFPPRQEYSPANCTVV